MASEAMREMAELIRAMNAEVSITDGSIEAMRERMEAQQAALPLPDDLERADLTLGARPARRLRTPGVREDRAVLYLHGGGYVMGSLDTHQELMGRIARTVNATVYGLDYRLAPEHPWPAAVDDAVAAWRDLLDMGFSPEQIVVAGDSAGGGLAMALLLALKDTGEEPPAGAVVFSPWTDLTASGGSVHTRAEADPMIRPDALASTAAHYLAGADPATPTISPLFGELAGLPPLLIQVGDSEVLLDDSIRLHERALAVGVPSTLHVFDEAFHVFQAVPGVPEAAEALEEMAAFCARVW